MSNNDVNFKEVDWKKVYQHLDASKAAVEQGLFVDPGEKNKILKRRARQLARKTGRIKEKEARIEVVEFALAYENYAIESRYVSEVYPLKEFTAIPCTPDFVLGIINLRGRIIVIIDLKKIFDLPDKGVADFNKVIIISSELNEFGIVADSITEVRSLAVSKIQTSLPTLTGICEDYIKGILSDRVVVLDAEMILADPKIVVYQEVAP
jgi:purine-binding chemotaxis protein CheW